MSARLRLKRIEAGVYATADRKLQVERIDVMGEFDTTSCTWVVMQYRDEAAAENSNGGEVFEAGTKRECVDWLEENLERLT